MSHADWVVTGNEFIRDAVRPWNTRCTVIPTAIDMRRYPAAKRHGPAADFTPVWIGGRSTLFYLEALMPHIEDAARSIPGFRLLVISDRFPEQGGFPIRKVTWDESGEVAALMEADCGLMPLSDDAWSQGKCGLKLLQYGAAGLPAVASPVGVNPEILAGGRGGFLARTPPEWSEALLRLWESPDLRARLGAFARRHIRDHYSLAAQGPRLAEVILRATGRGAGRDPSAV